MAMDGTALWRHLRRWMPGRRWRMAMLVGAGIVVVVGITLWASPWCRVRLFVPLAEYPDSPILKHLKSSFNSPAGVQALLDIVGSHASGSTRRLALISLTSVGWVHPVPGSDRLERITYSPNCALILQLNLPHNQAILQASATDDEDELAIMALGLLHYNRRSENVEFLLAYARRYWAADELYCTAVRSAAATHAKSVALFLQDAIHDQRAAVGQSMLSALFYNYRGDPQTFTPLVTALHIDSPRFRAIGVEYCWQLYTHKNTGWEDYLFDVRVQDGLAAVATDPEVYSYDRIRASALLIHTPANAEALRTMMNTPGRGGPLSSGVVAMAVAQLGEFGALAKPALPDLKRLQANSSGQMLDTITKTIERITQAVPQADEATLPAP